MEREPEITLIGPHPSEQEIQKELDRISGQKRTKYERFFLAAMSSIPWVGGLLSASASLNAENEQGQINELQNQWMHLHREKLQDLADSLSGIYKRIESLGPEAEARSGSGNYLALVRKGFGVWDGSDTKEKRELISMLLSNAAGITLVEDDLVRLFIEWIDKYHEIHFSVIRSIYKNTASTRSAIWADIYSRPVKENSAEADLFKLLIRDLSTGGVIRQHREATEDGSFLRKPPAKHRGHASPFMKSAFDDTEVYELTALGKKFVHYVMSDIVPRLSSPKENQGGSPPPGSP